MILNATSAVPDQEIPVSNGPLGFGWGINLDSNSDGTANCLVFEDFPKNKEDDLCWTNPKDCTKGFTLSIWEKITFKRDDTTERCIVSTGGNTDGVPGIALTYRGIYIHAVVSTGAEMWTIVTPGPVHNNTWNQLGIRWIYETGLEMFINAALVAYVQYSEKTPGPGQPLSPLKMTVGCVREPDGSFTGHAYGEFDELTGWMWALEPEQTQFLTGGFDNTTTCDPELNELHCETNPQKLLAMMDNVQFESADSLIDALAHVKKISEVEKDPAGSESEKDGDSKNNDALEALVAITGIMISKTNNKPDELTVSQLKKLLMMQDIASNLLHEQYHEGWSVMQQDGKRSVDFVQDVEQWILKKSSQTNSGKEPLSVPYSTKNIVSKLQNVLLYDLLESGESMAFSGEDGGSRKKRDLDEVEAGDKPLLKMTTKMFGDKNKGDKVCIGTVLYKNLDKVAPLWNDKSGNDTWLYFVDSEVVSASTDSDISSTAMEKEPTVVVLKHRRKEKASGRKLLEDDTLKQTGEIRRRECVRWDSQLEVKGMKRKGGWSTNGCSMNKTTAEETICECTLMGAYSIMSKIRQPFDIPPEEEWLKLCKLICFGISAVLLVFYILVIIFRKLLHEQFHIIRLNLAGAALGATTSFCLAGYMYENEDLCRILSMMIHFFYTAVGTWLTSEAHALFSSLVTGSLGSRFTCYVMIGWIAPGCLLGGCITLFPNYGYDYRCLVGPTAGMRWLLVTPVVISAAVAFTFSILTCINYGTPAVKKTSIVKELSSATRANFIVVLLFLSTWCCGIFALVDLGFDAGEIPAFNPIFQILNSCLGIFIVLLIGLSSNHFRYGLCHSGRKKIKNLHLDPFEIHDNAVVKNRKKIYSS